MLVVFLFFLRLQEQPGSGFSSFHAYPDGLLFDADPDLKH